MKIKNIINIFEIKYNIFHDDFLRHNLVADGIRLNKEKEAAFYNLRNAKKIILKDQALDG